MPKPECSVEDCTRPAHCRGWCTMHYERWRTHGDPKKILVPRRAPRLHSTDFDEEGKECSTCKRRLSLDAYYKRSKAADGLMYRCKDCCRDAYNKRYSDDPNFREQRARHTRSHYEANAEKIRRSRRRNLNKYGLTMDQFEEMNDKQNGLCAICGRSPYEGQENPRKSRLSVDHDHETGRVRGLLCDPCNTGIGLFKEDPNRMMSAITYLQERG
jgi:hypothetical protein